MPSEPARAPDGAARDRPGTAILLILGFALIVPLSDAAAKTLGESGMPAVQIAFARFAVTLLSLGPLRLARRRTGAALTHPAFLARGLCHSLGSACYFAGLAVLPMAEASALFLTQPLILTAMAGLLLGERIGWRRALAVSAGFAGALLILGPSAAAIGPAAALPVAGACFVAASSALVRRFAATGSALDFIVTTALIGTLLFGAALALGTGLGIPALTPRRPEGADWGLLLAVGGVATVANLMVAQAFRLSPASRLAPVLYVELLTVAAFGFILFGDLPGPATVAGALLVIAGGLFVWRRESRAAALARPRPRA